MMPNARQITALLQAIEAIAPLIKRILAHQGNAAPPELEQFLACVEDARRAHDDDKETLET
jgi:hypothetical protein